MKKLLILTMAALAVLPALPAGAYVLEGPSWAVPSVLVYLNLTASQAGLGANLAKFPLTDGSASYNQVYANAEAIWSSYLKNLKINTVTGSNAQGVTMSSGLNEVGFSSTIQGYALGQYTLGLTLYYYNPSSNPNRMTQTSTAINPGWKWNSYRGNLTYPVMDLRRVALHESGHMIGLAHPDQNGQVVNAIMNSSISNTDSLTTDDISGGQHLYGTP
ncbi:MAG: matrixin family metalloprotease [Verrucomicrobia bacterium]|nr:matrixin family metalloprotease [Verrucomicrobiota bacterium]